MVKRTPKKVCVLENGNYIEITYEEVCSNEKYKNKLFLPLHGMLLEVVEEDYKAFYKAQRREKYIREQTIKYNDLHYNMLDADEFSGEDILADKNTNVEETVERIIENEKLNEFMKTLSKKDKELVIALFFQELTERE